MPVPVPRQSNQEILSGILQLLGVYRGAADVLGKAAPSISNPSIALGGMMPMQFTGQVSRSIVPGAGSGTSLFRRMMESTRAAALNEKSSWGHLSGKDLPSLMDRMLASLRQGLPEGVPRVTPMDTSLRAGVEIGKLSPASQPMTNDIMIKLLSNYMPVGRW